MKIIKLLALLISFVYAVQVNKVDYKYYISLNPQMSAKQIKDKIESVPNNTLIFFDKGNYDLHGISISLKNKKNITIEGKVDKVNLVTINNCKLLIFNDSYINLFSINMSDVSLDIENTQSVYIFNDKFLTQSQLFINNSNGLIYKTEYNVDTTKYMTFKNSTFFINLLSGNAKHYIFSISSYIELSDSKFNSYNAVITANNSSLYIHDNNFLNQTSEKKYYSIFAENSILDANNNNFKDIYRGISVYHSKGFIYKNKFDMVNYPVLFNNNSDGVVSKNSFDNSQLAIEDYDNFFMGVLIENFSQARIKDNIFKKQHISIYVNKNSKAEIYNNFFGETLKNIGNKTFSGNPINISSNCIANIINNKKLGNVFLSFAKQDSKIYLVNNEIDFSLPGIGDPQVSDNKLPVNINISKDDFKYESIFDKIKVNIIKDYNTLKLYAPKIVIKKGYLKHPLTFIYKGIERVLPKDTYVEYNENNHKLYIPVKYQGYVLKDLPELYIPLDKIDIKVEPIIGYIDNEPILSFSINSVDDVKEILLDGVKMSLKSKKMTYPREIDINKPHMLIIKTDKIVKSYECVYSLNQIVCNENKKGDL